MIDLQTKNEQLIAENKQLKETIVMLNNSLFHKLNDDNKQIINNTMFEMIRLQG